MRHGRRRALATLLAVVALWAGSGEVGALQQRYRAMATTRAGAPVRWPCGTHEVHVQDAPSRRHVAHLRAALGQLSRATGQTWRLADPLDVDTESDDYTGSPVVVRFLETEGYAGLTTLWREGDSWSGGLVNINTDVDYVGAPAAPKDWERLRTLLLHEIGHLAGLGHVSDPALVMSDWGSARHRTYSPGDLEGLAALGCG